MNKSILLAFCFLYQVSIVCNPTIVMLIGSGSTGKTTIATAISTISSDWYIVDEDQVMYTLERQALHDEFPEVFETIAKAIKPENILSAIQNNQFLFDESADEITRNEAKIAIQKIEDPRRWRHQLSEQDILREINVGLQQDKNIILDDWFVKVDTIKEAFPDAKIIRVFVYSSLFACYKRFRKRNREVNSNLDATIRVHGQLIAYYVYLYTLTNQQTHPGNQSFPAFSKAKIDSLFDKISKKTRSDDNDLSLGKKAYAVNCIELTVSRLNELRKQLISEDLEDEPVFFEPNHKYDIVLNYENSTPELAALSLLHSIEEFC